MKFGVDESKEGNLKIAVDLFGGLFILLIITTTWLLSDNSLESDHEYSIATSPST